MENSASLRPRPNMAQPMAAADPTYYQQKAMFRSIKFSTDTATELVTGQVIDSIEDINTLTQDCMTRLCSIICNPGGWTDRHVVSNPAENIFHLLLYYYQHQERVTRDTDHFLVTLVNLRAFMGSVSSRRIGIQQSRNMSKPISKICSRHSR